MPEFNETVDQRRNRIAELLLAQDLAATAPAADLNYPLPHSPTSSFATPSENTPTFAPDAFTSTQAFAPTGPPAGSSGNLFSTEEGLGTHSAGSNMFGTPSAPSQPDFGRSGNLFAGGFNTFGGQYDPGDTGTPNPNGPADTFGFGAIGNFGTNMTPGTPLGDFSISPSINTTPGVPSDPGVPGSGNMASMISDMVAAMAADTAAAQGGDFSGPGQGSQGDNTGSEGASSGVG